jgi:hypothetical protein
MLWGLRTRASWRALPERFGNWSTADRRYRLGSGTGLRERTLRARRGVTDDAPTTVLR